MKGDERGFRDRDNANLIQHLVFQLIMRIMTQPHKIGMHLSIQIVIRYQLLPRGSEYPLVDKNNKWTSQESQNWLRTCKLWDKPESFVPKAVWQRQMVLLKDPDPKGPNYFVLRDTFGGKPTVLLAPSTDPQEHVDFIKALTLAGGAIKTGKSTVKATEACVLHSVKGVIKKRKFK